MTVAVTTRSQLNNQLAKVRQSNASIGFVPTMGALHEGHLSLIRLAKSQNDVVVVSIFVNPTQFNDPDDYRTYPRTHEADKAKLEAEGVDIAFLPGDEEMYPEGDRRLLDFDAGYITQVLEGAYRPGHFDGVATIVKILLDVVKPNRAYFGQKDYQQLLVVRQLVATYQIPVEVVAGPVVREADGLALSSRNVLLSKEERAAVPVIYQTLMHIKSGIEQDFKPRAYEQKGASYLQKHSCFDLDYFAIRHAETLKPVDETDKPEAVVLLVALRIGKVRLIDNMIAYPATNAHNQPAKKHNFA